MSGEACNADSPETKRRPVGGTEYSWCRAVPGGTGITVLALLLTKEPDYSLLQDALHKLQYSHSILRSLLHFDALTSTFSFTTSPTTSLQIQHFDLHSTAQILQTLYGGGDSSGLSPFHLLIEHEMNKNTWLNLSPPSNAHTPVFYASVYTVSDTKWTVMLRLHTGACDRAAAVTLLRELSGLMGDGGRERELKEEVGGSLGIEDYVPNEKAHKPFWARGLDVLGYSMNSFRLANLDFKDAQLPRSSQFVRLKINSADTDRILSGCKTRGIKLSGLLAAAVLIAVRASKNLCNERSEKYSVATLVDCRSHLDPVLSCHYIGFYHSAIINSHDVNGCEKLWDLAKRVHSSFASAKGSNKHLTDMSDLNFLMVKAIENPGLTTSSSLRTSIVSVFEDPVFDRREASHGEMGLEDYVGCASVHGVGPSIAIFDTIRDGELDSACVYPSPLHSREQIQGIIRRAKGILLDGCG